VSHLNHQLVTAFFDGACLQAEPVPADRPVPYALTARAEALLAAEPEPEPEAGL
jgi:hypothetical protein